MSSDPETTRIVRSWLDEGVTELPDRVLDAVLDQVPATPQRRATWWPARRLSTMNTTLKFGLAAVVVAVAALIGINYLTPATTGAPGPEDATPTPAGTPERSAEATSEPTPASFTHDLSLPEYPISLEVTVPSRAWSPDPGGGVITRGEAGIISFVDPGYYVYGDPCRWSTTRPEEPAATVDELVAALSAQASRDATDPLDISLDGYPGKSITLHVPDDAAFDECDDGLFASWATPEEEAARYHQDPGQIDTLWIVDVDGNLVIIDAAYYEETPQEVVDELHAIVESVAFD